MITKAIVNEIIDNGHKAIITIPIFSSNMNDKEGNSLIYKATATICSLNNAYNIIRPNDIVIIGFENEDISKPVILGQLYRQNIDLEGDTRLGLNLSSLSTTDTSHLSSNTYIGNVTPENIEGLIGLQCNIQEEINKIKKYLNLE